jgi:hypothetical protein
MSAKILYFGPDKCHRLLVLVAAGYVVENCDSLQHLDDALRSGQETRAILLSDQDSRVTDEAITLARSQSGAPVILFRDSNRERTGSSVDLVVPTLTSPSQWLSEIAALLSDYGLLRTEHKLPRKSRLLHAESTPLREPPSAIHGEPPAPHD